MEETFRKACEQARRNLDEQTCFPAEVSRLSEIKEDTDLLLEVTECLDCSSSNLASSMNEAMVELGISKKDLEDAGDVLIE